MGMGLRGVGMVRAAVGESGGRRARMRCRVISNTRSLQSLTKHDAGQQDVGKVNVWRCNAGSAKGRACSACREMRWMGAWRSGQQQRVG